MTIQDNSDFVDEPNIIEKTAGAFYASACILGFCGGEFYDLDMIGEKEIDRKDINEGIKIPQMVLQAFAAELYLKSLLFNDNTQVRGHELYDLFSQLNANIRHEIINDTIKWITNLYPERKITEQEFEIYLIEISKVFVDWRYVYEKESIDIDIQFFDAFIKACLSKYEVKITSIIYELFKRHTDFLSNNSEETNIDLEMKL